MAKAIQEATPATVETCETVPPGNGLVKGHTFNSRDVRNRDELARRKSLDDWSKARRALLKTCKRRDSAGLKRLDQVADKVMDMAIAGNMQAIQFVFERLDGKGVQQIDMKQDITVSSIGEAHLHALQRLTDAVTRHDEAKTLDIEVDTKQDSEPPAELDTT